MIKYNIKFYKETEDFDKVLKLLHKDPQFADTTMDMIRGPAMVAVNEKGDKALGFVWALVGLSSTALVDYLIVDMSLSPDDRENVWLDLCMSLFAVLQQSGVKEIIIGVTHPKVKRVFQALGFEEQPGLCPMKSGVEKIASILTQFGQHQQQQQQKLDHKTEMGVA